MKKASEKRTAVCNVGKNLMVLFKKSDTEKFELVYSKHDRDVSGRRSVGQIIRIIPRELHIPSLSMLQHAIRLIDLYLRMEKAHKKQLSLLESTAMQQEQVAGLTDVRLKCYIQLVFF